MGYTSEKITRTVGLTLTRYKDYTYTGKTEEDYGLKITPPTRLVIIDSIKSSNGDESLWRSAVDRGLLYLGLLTTSTYWFVTKAEKGDDYYFYINVYNRVRHEVATRILVSPDGGVRLYVDDNGILRHSGNLSENPELKGLVFDVLHISFTGTNQDYTGYDGFEPKNYHKDYYSNNDGIEAIDIIERSHLHFNLGNVLKYVLKYLMRAGKKTQNKVSDYQTASWHINYLLNSRSLLREQFEALEPYFDRSGAILQLVEDDMLNDAVCEILSIDPLYDTFHGQF
jgi:hypothetical protein